MTTYRIIRQTFDGSDYYKIQKKLIFWWTDVQRHDDHKGLLCSRSTIWFKNIFEARHWINLTHCGKEVVIETVKVNR